MFSHFTFLVQRFGNLCLALTDLLCPGLFLMVNTFLTRWTYNLVIDPSLPWKLFFLNFILSVPFISVTEFFIYSILLFEVFIKMTCHSIVTCERIC